MMAPARHLVVVLVMAMFMGTSYGQEGLEVFPVEGGTFPCGNQLMDVVLVLDVSDNAAALDAFRIFAVEFARFLNLDSGLVRIGVVTYSAEVDQTVELTRFTQTEALVRFLTSLRLQRGRRDTAGGLQAMRLLFTPENGDRPDAPNLALLLTSGNSVLRATQVPEEARLAHEAGISVFAVAVGIKDEREVDSIVSAPTEETKFVVNSFEDLAILPDVVVGQMCARLQSLVVDELQASTRLDLVFLLHFSDKTTQRSLGRVQALMKSMVDKADIDSGAVRVGTAVYRRRASAVFNLNQYGTKAALLNGIDGIPLNLRSAPASAASGLDFVRESMMTEDNGDRPDVANAVVVITDSNSDVDVANTVYAAQNLRNAGATVFAIGVGLEFKDELEAIAGSGRRTYVMNSFDELEGAKDEIVEQITALQGRAVVEEMDVPEASAPRTVDKTRKLDVAVVFHTSKNVDPKNLNKVFKPFLEKLFEASEIDSGQIRVSLSYFTKNHKIVGNLLKFRRKADYTDAVNKLPPAVRSDKANGGAAMQKLLAKVFTEQLGDRPDASNVVLLITDEKINMRPKKFVEEAQALKEAGVKVVTLGLEKADKEELLAVSSEPASENALMVTGYQDLQKEAVVELLRTAMFMPLPSEPDVEVVSPGPTVINLDTREIDLAIMIHMSPKMKPADLKNFLKPFLNALLQYADIDGGKVQVSLSFYRKQLTLMSNLKKIKTRSDYANAVNSLSMKIRGKQGDGAGALKRLRERVFDESRGDRPEVHNVVLIVTDDKNSGDQMKFLQEANKTKSSGVRVVTFGVGSADKNELYEAASGPGDVNSMYVPRYSDMQDEETIDTLRSKVFALEDIPAQPPRPPTRRRQETELSSTASDSRQLDLAVVFHVSSDTKVNDIDDQLKPFLKDLFEYADIDGGNVRVAVSYYRKNPTHMFPLQRHKTRASLVKAFDEVGRQMRGKVGDTGLALEEARTTVFDAAKGDRADVPNAVLLLTNAKENVDQQKFLGEAESLKRAGIKLVTIGLEKADRAELQAVASEPANRNSFYYRTFDQLRTPEAMGAIRSSIYALQDLPALPPPTTRPPPRTRPTTIPTTTTTTAAPIVGVDLSDSDQVDLVFAFHFDPRRSEEDYQRLIRWLQSLVNSADIDSGNVRIGLYIDDQYIPFNLDGHETSQDVSESLAVLPKAVARARRFNVLSMLRTVRNRVFQEELGDRPEVPNGLIIITDTTSTDKSSEVEQEARILSEAGTAIYTVGVGLSDKGEMERVASSSRNVYAVSDYAELEGNVISLRREIKALSARGGPTPSATTPARITLAPPRDACTLSRTDLVIVIDTSTSVTEVNFEKVKRFVKEFLSNTDIDSGNVRVGIVIYSTEVAVQFQLNEYRTKREILNAVDRIPYMIGSTNTADGIKVMRTEMFTPINGDRADVPNVAIVITDGVSNINSARTVPEAQAAHSEGIHVYAIGVGLTDTRELDAIATPPADRNSFAVKDFDELNFLYQHIFASACPGVFTFPPSTTPTTTPKPTTTTTKAPTTTTTTPTTTTRTTTTPTTTTTRTTPTPRTTTTTTPRTTTTTTPRPTTTTTRRTTTTTTRTTTTRTTTTPRTTTTRTTTTTTPRRRPVYRDTGTDLVFMLDSSVNDQIFGWMKNFVRRFAGQVPVDEGEYRIGAMTFSSSPSVQFHLNRYNFQDEVLNAVDNLRTRRGPVDTARAFDYVRNTMFSYSNGDRPRARNYIVLLTGNERSQDTQQTFAAAERLKDLGVGIYTVGINLRDTAEIDSVSSKPLETFQTLINSERQMDEIPGIYKSSMESAPEPTTRLTTTTTRATTTTTPRVTRPIPALPVNCDSTGDVTFILDSSGSVGEENFDRLRNFTIAAVRDLEIDNGFFRVAVVTFSDSATVNFYLNTYFNKQEMINAIRSIPYDYGYTHTAHALRRTRTEIYNVLNGDRPTVPNLVVIVTDGESNINPQETLPEAARIKRGGTTIITVAVGLASNAELVGLTSPPVSENLIYVDDYEALHRLSAVIVAPLCTDPNMCERNPCQNEAVCVDGLRSYMCICQPGYYGDNCEKRCGPKTDVVFILDSSSTVGWDTFNRIKMYAEILMRSMNVDSCDINVGAMKYSSAAMIQFRLGMYDNTESISSAINSIGYTHGRANLADALRVLRTQMFNGRNGDRPDAKNVAYLLTDGSSEINRHITLSEADLIIDSGVRLIPLVVTAREREEVDQVEQIASAQGMQLLSIESETRLQEMSDQVLQAMFDREGEGENRCTPSPCQNGGSCINEPLGYRCECAAGFTGDNCEQECSAQADVVFLVDSSRYNSRDSMRAIKRFARDIVKRMAFRGGNFRVGVVSFGANAQTLLTFSEGDDKRAVKTVIGSIRSLSGDPNLNIAVQRVDVDIIGRLGDRESVPNYLVIITTSVGPDAVDAINTLKRKGTKVIGVGIDLSNSDRMYMESAVSQPTKDMMFLVPDAVNLESLTNDFVNFVCEEKNLCAENPCRNGGECVNGDKDYVCECRRGFAGKNCERTCSDRADIVFLLDMSGSVGYDNFRRVKDYVYYMVENFNIGPDATQVGVATFSQNARAQFYLDEFRDKRKLQNAISAIGYEYGNTNTAAGLKLVRAGMFSGRRGDRAGIPDYAIVITDGLSNVNAEQTIPEAELARKQGIHIFAIGVGISDPWELRAIASEPADNNAFVLNQFSDLWNISSQLIDATCKDAGVCSPSPCQNGGTCVPGVGTYICQCRVGFLGTNCELNCQSSKDICIVLDSSTSVGPGNFELMIEYVKALVKDLTGGGQDHRFSLITYSTEVKTIFSFNRYPQPQQVLDAISTTRYTPGSTNTAGGLRQAREMFQPSFGDRPSADNLVILLTDGQSNVNFYDTIPSATALKSDGVTIIGIGIGLSNADELNAIASSPGDVFQVATFEALDDIKGEIVSGSCRPVERSREDLGR